ncbi:MAG: type II toxin-antitoxin system VapC family toxin [bacterium]
MYLIDTNIFLEALLEQEKTNIVRSFFQSIDLRDMLITDLSLHSIGIILFRLNKFELFDILLNDIIIDGIGIISLKLSDLKELKDISKAFNLDFDDAYQYLASEKHDLLIISFDKDFDRTKRKRKEPQEIIS